MKIPHEDGCYATAEKAGCIASELTVSGGRTRSLGTTLKANFQPPQNAANQDVLFKMAKCTVKEISATAPRNSGSPTVGFTTHQILP